MRKGFYYRLEKEKIMEYMKLTPKQKLEWLEEIFIFSEKTMTEETKRIREYFRRS